MADETEDMPKTIDAMPHADMSNGDADMAHGDADMAHGDATAETDVDKASDPLQYRIDYHKAQLDKARKAKRARDARERRKAAKEAKEARARKAEELLSFLEGHTVTRKGQVMTGLAYVEMLRADGAFSPLADGDGEPHDQSEALQAEAVMGEHGTDSQGVADSRSDSDTPQAGISVDALLSTDARNGGVAR